MNCRDHITELNSLKPKQPFFFLKPTSSLLLPGQGPVLLPKGVNVHYEVELGLVIGKTVRDLDPEDHQGAMDSISSSSPFPFTKTLPPPDFTLWGADS